MSDCKLEAAGLVVLSLSLLISLSLNILFCRKRRSPLCKGKDGCCNPGSYKAERLSLDEGHYFHHEQENNDNHEDLQDNPIYGNISNDRRGSSDVCYEMMNMKPSRDRNKTQEADLNYASLDLKLAKKHKKRPRQQQHQGRRSLQEQQVNAFLEVDASAEAHLPPRDNGTMVSHSSIYLNSQQIAQEAEEMERERMRGEEGERRTMRKGEEERGDFRNGDVCVQLSEEDDILTNHFSGHLDAQD